MQKAVRQEINQFSVEIIINEITIAIAWKTFFCKYCMSNYFSELRLLVVKASSTFLCQNKSLL